MDPHLSLPSGRPRGASASSSRRSVSPPLNFPNLPNHPNPPTPGAYSETGVGDYFDPISEVPTSQSRVSLPTSVRIANNDNPNGVPLRPVTSRNRLPSIRLRRTSNGSLASSVGDAPNVVYNDSLPTGRQRSVSQPERARLPDDAGLARHSRRAPQIAMPRLTEEGARPTLAELGVNDSRPISPTVSLPDDHTPGWEAASPDPDVRRSRMQRARQASRMLWPGHHRRAAQPRPPPTAEQQAEEEYNRELVDWLDIIDPEVQTLSTLTNVQNSLFVPDLGNWLNRRPTYVLSQRDVEQQIAREAVAEERRQEAAQAVEEERHQPPPLGRSNTITSRLTDSHFAALPHGTTLEGWSAEEKLELDDHVRHMLHSRRSRFKRRLKGFGQYVKRPLGFFVTLYATLITLFGLAWVLFLIGWIYVGEKQVYAIHIIDSILVALFAVMGDGLAPFRAIDTYHMIFIARYSRMIDNAKKGKPPRARLQKRNIPPEIRESMDSTPRTGGFLEGTASRTELREEDDQFPDLELTETKNRESNLDYEYLTPQQRQKLEHHQTKLAKSHSFYKPHETFTHHSFPLGYLIAIVILLDCHSCLQISLGACTWGIDYHTRPFALTTVILCVSITCNITAGLVITIGDRKTRKKDVLNLLNRQELTEDAMKHIEKKRREQNGDSEDGESSKKNLSKEDSDSSIARKKLSKEEPQEEDEESARKKLTKEDTR